MQQRGSKYDQKFKEEALALVASGVSITNAACRLRIPKSTLADWVHTQNEGDEDGIAARREIRRTQIKRCNKVRLVPSPALHRRCYIGCPCLCAFVLSRPWCLAAYRTVR